MRLTQTEFDEKRANGELRLALIGMSNIGKSYTAERIAKADGFTCYEIDAQIQEKLLAKMKNPSMEEMAKWMGHPYSEGYAEKAAEYLAMETELSLQASTHKGNLVLDTTGSVIHIADAAKQTLKDDFLVIYIKASSVDIDVLINRYFKFPKPTIWGDNFNAISGKTNRESLLSCYPGLLKLRAELYADLADITVAAADLAKADMNDSDIIPYLRGHLPCG